MFARKLDFLMNLTNTHNIALARAINVDASAISRLRTGKRGLPKYHDFLTPMSAFLAKRITEEYQKKSASDKITPNKLWPESIAEAADAICIWLLQSDEVQSCSIEHSLSEVSEIDRSSTSALPQAGINVPLTAKYYYGLQGFHSAVINFFDAIIANGHPRDILLFSGEESDRLTGNHTFAERWSPRLSQIIKLGCRVKIVLGASDPIDEILSSVAWWLPLYLTSAIIPYYIPKIRDALHKRSLFVASGLMAVESTVVGIRDEYDLVQIITDKSAVAALEHEYNRYLALSSPLMELSQKGSELHFLRSPS